MKVNDFNVTCYDHVTESTSSVKYLDLHLDNFVFGEMIFNKILSKVNARQILCIATAALYLGLVFQKICQMLNTPAYESTMTYPFLFHKLILYA